jgi:hypothetical protein
MFSNTDVFVSISDTFVAVDVAAADLLLCSIISLVFTASPGIGIDVDGLSSSFRKNTKV